MRNVAFLAAGIAILAVQANVFRAVDALSVPVAVVVWLLALVMDFVQMFRELWGGPGQRRAIATFRAEFVLPATVLLAHAALTSAGYTRIGRPIPALVLPLILFMGVHEYSLTRGAAVAFVLGYATDVVGIAPIGLYTFTYVATFALSRAAGMRLAAQTTWTQVVLVAAFTLLQSTMVLVLLAIFGRDAWVPRSLYPLALPHTVATAAVAPLVFRVALAIHTATGSARRSEAAGSTST